MKKTNQKPARPAPLLLSTEKIRTLTDGDLRAVAGGAVCSGCTVTRDPISW